MKINKIISINLILLLYLISFSQEHLSVMIVTNNERRWRSFKRSLHHLNPNLFIVSLFLFVL